MTVAEISAGKILPEFTMDHLGTSFKVILVNSVRQISHNENGETETFIPDEQGLHKAIASKRALDPKKLTGGDIKFLRKSLGMRAKDLASTLDISAEYLSRCEAGDKTMASNVEKMLRLVVLLEIYYVLEKATEIAPDAIKRSLRRLQKGMEDVREVIRSMRIIPAASADTPSIYRFQRRSETEVHAANDDDHCEWLKVA
jgi:DNA-binding transcriptional regulator YiaG